MNWTKVIIHVESMAEELPFQVIGYHIYLLSKRYFTLAFRINLLLMMKYKKRIYIL